MAPALSAFGAGVGLRSGSALGPDCARVFALHSITPTITLTSATKAGKNSKSSTIRSYQSGSNASPGPTAIRFSVNVFTSAIARSLADAS